MRKDKENIIYLLISLIILLMPVFILRNEQQLTTSRIIMEWIRILPFFFIFIFNNAVLIPVYLFKKKQALYFVLLSISIIVIAWLGDYTRYFNEFIRSEGPPPDVAPDFGHMLPPIGIERELSPWQRITDTIILGYMVAGFNTAMKLILKSKEDEKQHEEQQKIMLQTELSFLRQQISPHFFMNTLNNIHALIDIEKTQAQEAVIQLSRLMRYLLTESQNGTAVLKDELDFLNSFIDLMRLRYSDRVEISVDLNIDMPERKIHPLLFVSLVENAFKYGVSYSKPSAISIQAKTSANALVFSVKNRKFQETTESGTGLGLENLRKQLALLYGSNFSLEILETADIYHVELKIPFADD